MCVCVCVCVCCFLCFIFGGRLLLLLFYIKARQVALVLVFQGQRDRRKDTTFGFHEDLFKYKKTRCNTKLMRTPHLPLGAARPCLHEQLSDACFGKGLIAVVGDRYNVPDGLLK